MPNKRDPDKAPVNFYINRNVKEQAMELLQQENLTLTEYLTAAIYELIQNDKNEKIRMLNEMDGRTRKGKARLRNKKSQ